MTMDVESSFLGQHSQIRQPLSREREAVGNLSTGGGSLQELVVPVDREPHGGARPCPKGVGMELLQPDRLPRRVQHPPRQHVLQADAVDAHPQGHHRHSRACTATKAESWCPMR